MQRPMKWQARRKYGRTASHSSNNERAPPVASGGSRKHSSTTMIPRRAILRYQNCPAMEGHDDLDEDMQHTNKQRLEDSFTSLATPNTARTMPHSESHSRSINSRQKNNSDSFSTFASFASAPTTIQSHLKQRDATDISKKDAPSIAGATATTVATSTTSREDSLATVSSSFATPSLSAMSRSSFSSPSGMRRQRGLAPSAREIRPSRLDNIVVRNSSDGHEYEEDDDDVSLGFFSPTTGKRNTVHSTNAAENLGENQVVVSVTPDLFELSGDDRDMDTTMNNVAANNHHGDRDLNHRFAAWDAFGNHRNNNKNISAVTLEHFHASFGSATPSFLSHQSTGKHCTNSSGSGSGGRTIKTRHEMLDQRRKQTTTAAPPSGDSSERSGPRTVVASKSRSKRGSRSTDDKKKKRSDEKYTTSDNHTSRSGRTSARNRDSAGDGIALDNDDEKPNAIPRSRCREHRTGDHQERRSKDHHRTRSKSIGRNEGKTKRESGHSKRRGRKVDKFLSEEEIDRLIGNCLTSEPSKHNCSDSLDRKDETFLSPTKTTRRKHRSSSKSQRASPRSVLDVDAVEGSTSFSPVKPMHVKSCAETDFGPLGAILDPPCVVGLALPPQPPSSDGIDDEDPFSTPIVHYNRKVPLSPVQTGSIGGRRAFSSSSVEPRISRPDLSSRDKAGRPPRQMDNTSRMDLGKPVPIMANQQTMKLEDSDFSSAVASPRRQLSGHYELRRSTVSKMRSNDARQRKGQVLDSLSTFL